MNELDKYREQKDLVNKLHTHLEHLEKPHYDKMGLSMDHVSTYEGTYGSSSVHPWDTNVTKAVLKKLTDRYFLIHATKEAICEEERKLKECAKKALEIANEIIEQAEEDTRDEEDHS